MLWITDPRRTDGARATLSVRAKADIVLGSAVPWPRGAVRLIRDSPKVAAADRLVIRQAARRAETVVGVRGRHGR
jgi:hypothetical protein